MKALLRQAVSRLGGRIYSRRSLPTGIDWLHDIVRARAIGTEPVCFDVGANVGQTVAELLHRFPGARIHAFEPFCKPRAALIEAARAHSRVTVVPLALGAEAQRMQVVPHALSEMSSLARPHTQGHATLGEAIDVVTLDAYCSEQRIDTIDILKTDTEGYDLEVLRGAAGMLGGQRIGYVYVEVTFLPDNAQNTPFSPVFDLLSAHGYRFLGLYETYPLHHFKEPMMFCNALFVAGRIRERSLAQHHASP